MYPLTKTNTFSGKTLRNTNILDLTSALHFQSAFTNNFITFSKNLINGLRQASSVLPKVIASNQET